MICESCKIAGALLKDDYSYVTVGSWHAMCDSVSKDKTHCDCAHKTVSMINRVNHLHQQRQGREQ